MSEESEGGDGFEGEKEREKEEEERTFPMVDVGARRGMLMLFLVVPSG